MTITMLITMTMYTLSILYRGNHLQILSEDYLIIWIHTIQIYVIR